MAKQNQNRYGLPMNGTAPMIDQVFNGTGTGLSQAETLDALKGIVNELSNEEIQTANPNIKGNLLYGYGAPALSYDGHEYPYIPEWDEHAVPEGQDTLNWHFYNNPLFGDTVDFHNQASQEQKDQLAREFTLLRNANDYRRQMNLDQFAAEQRQRDLYGDTLVDLLQNTPEGQSILGTVNVASRNAATPEHRSRERNITGPGTGAFIR